MVVAHGGGGLGGCHFRRGVARAARRMGAGAARHGGDGQRQHGGRERWRAAAARPHAPLAAVPLPRPDPAVEGQWRPRREATTTTSCGGDDGNDDERGCS